ncbi:MAG: hypothetical protein LBC99_02665 [Spirochaetota bacterium]|jgi:adenylate cyclase class IV|nr:hypothetical protein [Spirochaetota bacterium]
MQTTVFDKPSREDEARITVNRFADMMRIVRQFKVEDMPVIKDERHIWTTGDAHLCSDDKKRKP